jgi:hypothetical protein
MGLPNLEVKASLFSSLNWLEGRLGDPLEMAGHAQAFLKALMDHDRLEAAESIRRFLASIAWRRYQLSDYVLKDAVSLALSLAGQAIIDERRGGSPRAEVHFKSAGGVDFIIEPIYLSWRDLERKPQRRLRRAAERAKAAGQKLEPIAPEVAAAEAAARASKRMTKNVRNAMKRIEWSHYISRFGDEPPKIWQVAVVATYRLETRVGLREAPNFRLRPAGNGRSWIEFR